MIKGFFKLQPAFQLNIVFFIGMCILVVIFSDKVPFFVNFFLIYASLALFSLFISKTGKNVFLSFIKDIGLPVVSVLIAFDTIGELVPHINSGDIDHLLLKLDYLILGFYPYVYIERFATPFLTELMQISYCFYYILPFFIGFYLIKNENKMHFYRALFLILFCYYLSYIGYILFPALGPRYSIPYMFKNEINGLFFADKINSLLNSLEGLKRDAFPSGHVAISLVILSLMYKYNSKLFFISFIPVIFLIFSTIYCKYHYFVDVVGGIILAVVTLVIGNLYYNFWLKKNGDSNFKR